jgi:hypothetical protein
MAVSPRIDARAIVAFTDDFQRIAWPGTLPETISSRRKGASTSSDQDVKLKRIKLLTRNRAKAFRESERHEG